MTGNQETFHKAMSQGNSAAWDQNWDLAASFFQQALAEIPDHPLALNNLGLALFEMQRWQDALKVYRRAAAVAPTDPVPWEKIAAIYERQGMLKEAVQASIQAAELHLKARNVEKSVESFVRALSIDPNHLTAHTRLAMIFDKTGKKAESATEYISIASLLQSNGDIAKAMQAVQYALSLIPNHPEALQALTMLRNGQRLPPPTRPKGGTGPMKMSKVRSMASPDALPAGKIKLKGRDPIIEARQAALEKLASYLFEMSEDIATPAARRDLDTLMRGTTSLAGDADRNRIHLHLSAAIDAQTQGLDQAAAEDLQRAIDAGLSSPAANFDLGLLLAKHNPDQALQNLRKSIQVQEFSIASHLLMGEIYLARDQVKEAALEYLRALEMADLQTVPEDKYDELLQAYESIFESQVEQGNETVLRKLCANLVNQLIRPDWREYLQDARRQMPGQSDGSAVLPLAEMLLESRSSQVVTALARVRELSSKGKNRAALDEALYALEFAPTYLPLHVQIGELLLKDEHVSEAAEKFLMVASLYSLRGENTQAVRLLQRVGQLAPSDIHMRTRLIDMLLALGQTDEAIQQIINQAEMYMMLADLESARQTYFTALTLTQKSPKNRHWGVQILTRVADIDMQRLDWRSAIRTFEQLRTLQPEEPAHRQRLVDLNLRLGMEKEALAEVESFLTVMDNASHRAAAAQFLEEVLADYPNQLELRRHLAELYLRLDNHAKAIEHLDLLADGLLTANRIPETIAVVQSIIQLSPPNVGEYRALLEQLHANQ